MKTVENPSILTTPNAMGRSVAVKTPAAFQIVNEINGFEHVSYGMALQAFHMSNERIVSIHIEKTGGTSLLRFFCDLYAPENVFFYHPRSGFMRQDKDPARQRRSFIGDRIKSVLSHFPRIYRIARRALHKTERLTSDFAVPDTFSVIHGHFCPNELSVRDALYVTVFREPLARTRSHFDDWKKWRNVISSIESDMTFEQFALQKAMVNFQTKRIQGMDVASFDHVGITEELDKYCMYFDPSGRVKLPRLNQTQSQSRTPSSLLFLREFASAHMEDIKLYHHTKQLL